MEKNASHITQAIRVALRSSGQSQAIEDAFLQNLTCLLNGDTGKIPSNELQSLDSLPHVSELAEYEKTGKENLSKLLVLKLNGGLGTSMGLQKAKSLLPIKGEKTFLDIILQQVEGKRAATGVPLPLVFMNSFRTVDDTLIHVSTDFNKDSQLPISVVQHKVPKLSVESHLPVEWENAPQLTWCPPGHGDLYPVLLGSGLLQQAISSGYRYLFVSNADNLGATVSEKLLGYMVSREVPFLMEVANRTEVDRKGGHLARTKDGELTLRERAQVFEEDEEDFQDIHMYSFFNTNSLWIDLVALERQLEIAGGALPLPIIVNEKHVDPSDVGSPRVIQLETAMGAAISVFPGAAAVCVERDRFLPVKTTDDLLRMQSSIFTLTSESHMIADAENLAFPVELDKQYYGFIQEFNRRFPYGVPDLTECSSFQIVGDVTFGARVRCRGAVTLKAEEPLLIPDGAIIEGNGILTTP